MKDVLGNDRLTLFGDDVLNAINYTMERVPLRQHRKDQVVKAFDLAALFGLDGSLDKAGLPKNTAWTRARQHIKNSLNRSHALQARISDPDLLLHTLGSKNSDLDSVAANGEAEGDWVLFLVDFKTQKHNLNNISLSRIKKVIPQLITEWIWVRVNELIIMTIRTIRQFTGTKPFGHNKKLCVPYRR